MKRHLLTLILFLFALGSGIAQTFPVQLNPVAFPPHPVYLNDYADQAATFEKLQLQIILSDLTVENRNVRLKVYVEGEGINASSKDVVVGAPALFLDGGIPLQLNSVDLAPYFEFQNLQGITQTAYAQSLPEGIYNFCYEIYDVISAERLSQKSCSSFILFQNDPPLLNLPLNEAIINEMNPTNINFTWTPRHINVTNVQYEFTMVEIWDENMDPQALFLGSQPFYQTITSQTSLLYGPAEPLLLTGKRYAWRVRAFATQGNEEIGVFTNNGFSEIYWFDYPMDCGAPAFLSTDELSDTFAKVSWQGDLSHLDYTVMYREKNANSDWYELETPRDYLQINNLAPETTYEYKIRGNCQFNSYGESPMAEFTTLDESASAYQGCNIEPDPVDLSNQDLLQELFINDVFTAGDFPVTVLEVTSGNAPFSGGGFINVPYLLDTKIAVVFNGIQINTDMQLVSGVVETTYDADWGNIDFLEDFTEIFEGANDLDVIELDFDITTDNIEVNDDGTITITDPDTGITVNYPGGDDVTITDASGDVFNVSSDGTITEGGQVGEGGPIDTSTLPGFTGGQLTQLSAQGIKVVFQDATTYTYGYDAKPNVAGVDDLYEEILDASGNPYGIVNKAVQLSGIDAINAQIITNDDALKDQLVFKTEQGAEIEKTITNDIATLTLNGQFEFESQRIYATLQPQDSTDANQTQTIAGAFDLWHLAQRDVNLTVVAINGATIPDNLNAVLNDQVFKKAAVQFNITETTFNLDPATYGGDTVQIGESGAFANYTDDQRNIINAYKAENYDPDQYYIFLFDQNIAPSRSVGGFMPLGRQFGFVFSTVDSPEEGKNSIAGTIAHEVGHGVFALEHPFTQLGTPQGSTNWLMDYGSGLELNHLDWAKIHDPGLQFYLFQDDEDGESAVILSELPDELGITFEEEVYYPFWTPSNKKFLLKKSDFIKPIFYYGIYDDRHEKVNPGSLTGFTLVTQSDSISYRANFSSTGEVFNGYKLVGGDDFYTPESYNNTITTDKLTIGYPSPISGSAGYIVAKHINDIQSFSAVSENVVETNTLSFFPNFSNQVFAKEYSDQLLIGDSQTSITSLYRNTINGHQNSEEYLLLLKIAEWRNRFPETFELFTTTFDDWDTNNLVKSINIPPTQYSPGSYEYFGDWNARMSENNNELFNQWSSGDKVLFYQTFLQEFVVYAKNQAQATQDCLSNFDSDNSISATELLHCLKFASEDQIRNDISYDGRMNAIKKLISQFWTDGRSEEAINKLIKHVPQNFDSNQFILDLENTCEVTLQIKGSGNYGNNVESKLVCLWEVLFESIDDGTFLFSGDNRKELITLLLNQYYKTIWFSDDLAAYQSDLLNFEIEATQNLSYQYGYQNIFRRLWTDVKFGFTHMYTNPNDFYSSIDTSVDLDNANIIAEQTVKTGIFLSNTNFINSHKPFDLVMITNLSNQDLLKDFTLTDDSGLPIAVPAPALLLHYMSRVGDLETQGDLLQTGVDVVSLVIPGGQLAQLSKIGKVIYYADKISSVTSIAGSAFRDDIPELADLFNKVSLATGVVSITDFAISSKLKNLRDLDALNRTPTQIANQTDQVATEINQLQNTLDNDGDNLLSYASHSEIGATKELLERDRLTLDEMGHLDSGKRQNIDLAISHLTARLNDVENYFTSTYPTIIARINDDVLLSRFISDFGQHPDKLDEILDNLDLVDAWKVCYVANVVDTLSIDINFLQILSNQIIDGSYSMNSIEDFMRISNVDYSYSRLNSDELFLLTPEISEIETISIHRYTKSSFDLNGNFYSGNPNSIDLAWAEILDNAIDKLQDTRKYEGSVFRGQNLDASLVQSKYIEPYNLAQSNGSTAIVTETGYLSTSSNTEVANNFIDQFYNPDKLQVKFIINSKTGVDIDDISDYGKNLCNTNPNCNFIQDEVIIKKGLNFEVINVYDELIDGRIVKIIRMNEL
ncbi:hypothetical protein GCM10009117_14630 [Gangjinia marincola]|uniref:Fibronectin type-III domain-containing protein n=1 Tax=Gangjinia marincola TaxID=578463 RepID=A0ABP3XWD3_9FLAO